MIRLGALGFTDKEIAEQLECAPRTVDTHFEGMRRKLGARFKRCRLPGLALLLGLVSVGELAGPALELLQGLIPDSGLDDIALAGQHEGAD